MGSESRITKSIYQLLCNHCQSTIDNGFSVLQYIDGDIKGCQAVFALKFCKCSTNATHTDISTREVMVFKTAGDK